MLKTNVLTLLIHFIISTLTFLLISGGVNNNFLYLLSIVIPIALYFVAGFLLSSRAILLQKSKINNLLSFSLMPIIGLIIWLVTFTVDTGKPFSYFLWSFYLMYNASFTTLIVWIQETFTHSDEIHPFLILWFTFIPVLLIWLGASLKRKKLQH